MISECNLKTAIDALIKESNKSPIDSDALAKSLLDYLECKNKGSDISLYQFGLPQNKELIEKISSLAKVNNNIWEKAVCNKTQAYFSEALKSSTHKKQKENLESAIRLLKDFTETHTVILPETYALLAEAYLKRSRIIRPKGRTISAKKKEAIEKGLKAIGEALKNDGNNKNALRMKASLYIELNRLGEQGKEDIKTVLKDALDKECKACDKKEDIKIAVLYSELTNNKDYLDAVIDSKRADIAFEKARAYRELSKENEFISEMNQVINSLKKLPFSHPLWDDTVWYLKKLWKSDPSQYKDISLQLSLLLWHICQENEKDISSPLHIRWYWSRMRDLYDLAFLAAGDARTKAIIADSLKSRPALQWNIWEELGKSDECIEAVLEAEAKALGGGYVIDYKNIKEKCKGSKTDVNPEKTPVEIDAVPADWIVIHFYLNKLEEMGYAVIANGKDSSKWEVKSFKYDKLFDAYMEWQGNYNRLMQIYKQNPAEHGTSLNKTASCLKSLCESIGNAMPFLFQLENNNQVLFVTHDFLHRLPLHGAAEKSNEGKENFFFDKHSSCYLPAWSLLSNQDNKTVSNGFYLIKKFEDYNYDLLINKSRFVWVNMDDGNIANELKSLKTVSTPPECLVILCHGKADMVNPFNAKLILEDMPTYLEIITSEINLNNSKVFLGACETDFVPPLTDIVDEHLSISTGFIHKKAYEVMGSLWSLDILTIEGVFIKLLNEKNQMETIRKLQSENKNGLFDYLPFRIIGFPYKNKKVLVS